MDVNSSFISGVNPSDFISKEFTVFEFLSGLKQIQVDGMLYMMAGAALLFTLTFCLAPMWEMSPRITYLFSLIICMLAGIVAKNWSNYDLVDTVHTRFSLIGLALTMPTLLFNCTLHIDYHTLGRIIGPVAFISVTLFVVNIFLLSCVMYSISARRTTFFIKVIHALLLSTVTISHAIAMLEKTQIQVRQLQIMLQAEMLISFALYSSLSNILLKCYNINQMDYPVTARSMFIYSLWTFAGIFPGILAAWTFRQYVAYSYDDYIGQGACSTAFIIILFTLSHIFGSNGTLSVLAYGISLGTSKIKFNNKTAQFYQNSHDFQKILNGVILLGTVGFSVGISTRPFTFYDCSYVVIIFTTCMVSRAITFVLIHRIVQNMKLQVSWRHLIVGVQSPGKGSIMLGYSLAYVVFEKLQDGLAILQINVVLVFLSYIFNDLVLTWTMRAIGMYDLTRAKVVNMNVAVSQVNECRVRAVQALKVDRVIADANWLIVEQSTTLAHPYKNDRRSSNLLNEDEDFESQGQTRVVYCGECGVKGLAPLTKKEMDDVAIDVKHRILKAQRVSIHKQHEIGTLSRNGVKMLSNLVEKVLVRDEPIITAKDLKIQRNGSAQMQCLKTMFRYLFTVTSKKFTFIPTFPLRAFCFRLCTSRKYQITLACFSMIDLLFLLVMVNEYYTSRNARLSWLQILDFLFFTLFFVEFIIEILGIGAIQYFDSYVNLVEFACSCLLRTLELGLFVDSCIREGKFLNVYKTDPVIMYVKTMLLLRVNRIYVFLVALIPKLLNLVDKKMDDDLMKIYDIGKAYLITQEQVIKFVGHLVTNDKVYTSIVNVLESDRLEVAYELGLIKYDRATIATTNKTIHAIRHVVNTMYDCIANMKDDEFLDRLETAALLTGLEKVKSRSRNIGFIEPLEPHLVLSEIAWLKNDKATLNVFLKHARMTSYSKDEVIISPGDDPKGLFVIIEGLIKVSYVPDDYTINLNEKHGALPNYDFFTSLKFDLPQEDYVSGGMTIGETGIVTQRTFNMTAVCITSVHLLWFPTKVINAVVRESGNAIVYQAVVWKSVAIKISINVLQDLPQFRGWSRERLFMYLQDGVVPVLEAVPLVTIGEHVSDTILIEGIAMDYATRLLYVAPRYIPRTVATLLLPDSPILSRKGELITRLFIVPSVHSDAEDISGPEGLFKSYRQLLENAEVEGKASMDTDGKEGTESCKRHKKTALSAYTRKVLKAQKRNLKAMKFLEFIPTVDGPIEGRLATTTFVTTGGTAKTVLTENYPKVKYYDSSFGYIGDVADASEIRELGTADDVDEVTRSMKRSSKRQRSSSTLTDELNTFESMGTVSSASKTPGEILVINIDEEEDENSGNNREAQTNLRMKHISDTEASQHSLSH